MEVKAWIFFCLISLCAAATCGTRPHIHSILNGRPGPGNIGDRTLFVSSYSGTITAFRVRRGACGSQTCNLPILERVFETNDSAPSPAWMTLDPIRNLMYVVDEGRGVPNGSLASYHVQYDGRLELLQREVVGPSPAHVARLGRSFRSPAIAVAEYGLGGISTWLVTNLGRFERLQTFLYAGHLGPVPRFQDHTAPHEITTDPTGRFILVPDRGADLVRLFRIEGSSTELQELPPMVVPPGSGPRHLVFSDPDSCVGKLKLYVLTEITPGKVLVYDVSYDEGDMHFTLTQRISTTNPQKTNYYPAEINLSDSEKPDGRYLMASNRNDSSFRPGTPEAEDSIINFALDSNNNLEFSQLAPAGGSFPRTFQLNEEGDLVAVGLKTGLVLLYRDTATGKIGGVVASVEGLGEVTCVLWY